MNISEPWYKEDIDIHVTQYLNNCMAYIFMCYDRSEFHIRITLLHADFSFAHILNYEKLLQLATIIATS